MTLFERLKPFAPNPKPSKRDREMATQIFADPIRAHEVTMLLATARAEGRRSAIETTLNILYEEGGLMKARAEGRCEAFEECARIVKAEADLWLPKDGAIAIEACNAIIAAIRALKGDKP